MDMNKPETNELTEMLAETADLSVIDYMLENLLKSGKHLSLNEFVNGISFVQLYSVLLAVKAKWEKEGQS